MNNDDVVCPECDQPCTVVGEGYCYEEQYRVYPVSDCCTAEMDEDLPFIL